MNEPIATAILMSVTFCVSLWAFEDERVVRRCIFRPEDILAGKEYYRLVTSAFLHAGWMHLLLNLFTLHSFGAHLEWRFGPGQMLLVYFGSVIGGSLLSLCLHRHHDYSAYGASGGVCGLIFAVILMNPRGLMTIFPLPIAVPGWLYAVAFLAASFYAMKAGRDNIGHDAHIGGAMFGLLIAAGLHPELVRQHWILFGCMLLAGAAVFAYVMGNPLFLPLPAFGGSVSSIFSWTGRLGSSKRNSTAKVATRRSVPRVVRPAPAEKVQSDWLLAEIESHVGTLHRESAESRVWTDKFGRRYWWMEGKSDAFEVKSFQQALLELLSDAQVQFVILDTRQLHDRQVDQIRPFVADLPDGQFNRILRSYAFTPKKMSHGGWSQQLES
jgi:membrane associated rhomboid family serine protease